MSTELENSLQRNVDELQPIQTELANARMDQMNSMAGDEDSKKLLAAKDNEMMEL